MHSRPQAGPCGGWWWLAGLARWRRILSRILNGTWFCIKGSAMRLRRIVLPLMLILLLIALWRILINDCSYVGGMGSSSTICDCSGIEWVLYDRTASDGPRKTICIGIVRSTRCYQYIDGPTVECET